jgi:hypothetical protein
MTSLNQTVSKLKIPKLTCIYTAAGRTPCPENVNKMASTVAENAKNSAAFVFDLLGNSSVRLEQFDGTTSLPFKSTGKYNLAGKVVTTPPEIFKKIVHAVTPVIQAKGTNHVSYCLRFPDTCLRAVAVTVATAPTPTTQTISQYSCLVLLGLKTS